MKLKGLKGLAKSLVTKAVASATKQAVKHAFRPVNAIGKVGGKITRGITSVRKEKGYFTPHIQKNKEFAQLGYESLANGGVDRVNKRASKYGYALDNSLSSDEIKVFSDPKTKKVTVSYRGTAPHNKSKWKDLKSDFAIMTGREKDDRRFKQARHHFTQVLDKYGKDYEISTTGHSLGGQLSKHVNDSYKGKVKENVAFSRGSGFLEPFRKKQANTVDVSNRNDIISLGARLQGGKQIIENKPKGVLASHDINSLFS